jgi:hypothetical protein
MTRFVFTIALVCLVIYLVRRMFAPPPAPAADSRGPSKGGVPRGSPRALVCGDCGTQFEPAKDGWKCPSCGK